jgi:hypothetical protein
MPKGHKTTNTSQLQNQSNLSKARLHNLPAGQSNTQTFHTKHLDLANKPNLKNTSAQTFHAEHFDLANKPNPNIPKVTFKAGVHIQGSQNWQGPKYTIFRTYTPVWHDRVWWISHHTRIVFVFGGWYFWDAGYWCPAWGYEPNAFYAYDGPIYAYNDLDPGQVVANVQAALQAQGYYHGEVDGLLGPLTRAALADYQRDHGLYTTAAIDQPTLASLGLA